MAILLPSSEEDMCFLLNVPGEDVLGNGSFSGPTGGNKIHTYNLKFYFPETQNIQNEDFNKIFEAYIKTEEGTKIKSECKIAPRGKLNNIILADN